MTASHKCKFMRACRDTAQLVCVFGGRGTGPCLRNDQGEEEEEEEEGR